jgi:hypothetical protein
MDVVGNDGTLLAVVTDANGKTERVALGTRCDSLLRAGPPPEVVRPAEPPNG